MISSNFYHGLGGRGWDGGAGGGGEMGPEIKVFHFLNQWLELNFLCIHVGSYDKWFCIKSWQKFANLLSYVKQQQQQ